METMTKFPQFPLLRDPNESELSYFKQNPNVAGMATEDQKVIFNPFSNVHPKGSESIYKNEAARIFMRQGKLRPSYALTKEQEERFKGYGEPQDIKETIAARALSGDPSSGKLTKEQENFVKQLSEMLRN